MPHATKSALQDAREAFVAGLARRADALRPVVETFIADPSARVVLAELQRRLHALLASAQLFEEPALVEQLQRLTSRLDAVGLGSEPWQTPDSDLLLQLLASLDPQSQRKLVSGQVSGVPPAAFGRVSEPVLRGARDVSGRAPAPANETSVRPRNENRPPPAPAPAPVVPTHQVGAVMLERVLMVCSRPHAAELRSVLDEAPLELLHAADPEQALTLVERCAPSYALVAAEFATLPDIDLVGRLRQHPHAPVDGIYLMLPNGATYDADFVRQTGADGVLIEPISWEMLGPLLDRPGFDGDDTIDPDQKLSLDGGLSEAFAQARNAADHAHRHVLESGRVPKAKPVEEAAASVIAHVQAASAQAVDSRAPAAPSGAFEARSAAAPSGAFEARAPAAVSDEADAQGAAVVEAEVAAVVEAEVAAVVEAEVAAVVEAEVAAVVAPDVASVVAPHVPALVESHKSAAPSGVLDVPPPAAVSSVVAPQPTAAILPSERPGERTRTLIGRRILVVDDDLAMLWFFSGVVRDAGGEALQARDGVDGLETARRKRPQVVLSDILMPKLDGFGLRRTLARDLWLERTPVLLLSWKGDPADTEARGPNAAGLLQKTASVPDVLAAIERALAPRKQLEEALRGDGAVTGEVGDLGIVALIECVVSARPDVRLTVEHDADVFDVDIADANQIAVTRTAADGTFTRAERALMQLIGVTHGRFHVRQRSGGLRSPVQTPLKGALHAAVSEITATIDAVTSERVDQVARLSFDEELLASRLKEASGFGPIISALRRLGMSPKQLLLEGVFSTAELSACLMVLARQTVITGLWGSDELDLLASATRLYMPRPVPSLPPGARSESAPVVTTPSPEVSTPAPAVATSPAVEVAAAPPTAASAHSTAAESVEAAPASAVEALPGVAAVPSELAQPTPPTVAEPTLVEVATAKAPEPEPESEILLPPAAKVSAPPSVTPVEALRPSVDDPEATFESDPEAAFAQEANPELAAEIAHARRRRRDSLLLSATLAASAVLGYVGALQLETHEALFGRTQPIGTRGLEQPLMAAVPSSETSVRSGLDPSFGLGTVLPYIDTTRGVPVGSDEGLVIFEYVGPLPTPHVEIDGRVLGSPPLSVALAATPHQLKLWVAGEPTLRTLSVRAGETRVITLPLLKP